MDELASKTSRLFANVYVIIGVMLCGLTWGIIYFLGYVGDDLNLLFNLILSIVTLLVAMLLQKTQDRDTKAIHAKLDEIVRVIDKADDRLIGLEKLPVTEIERIKDR